jgi:hypothetical protein
MQVRVTVPIVRSGIETELVLTLTEAGVDVFVPPAARFSRAQFLVADPADLIRGLAALMQAGEVRESVIPGQMNITEMLESIKGKYWNGT